MIMRSNGYTKLPNEYIRFSEADPEYTSLFFFGSFFFARQLSGRGSGQNGDEGCLAKLDAGLFLFTKVCQLSLARGFAAKRLALLSGLRCQFSGPCLSICVHVALSFGT